MSENQRFSDVNRSLGYNGLNGGILPMTLACKHGVLAMVSILLWNSLCHHSCSTSALLVEKRNS